MAAHRCVTWADIWDPHGTHSHSINPHPWSHGEFLVNRWLRNKNSVEAQYTGINWKWTDIFRQPYREVALKDTGKKENLPSEWNFEQVELYLVVTWKAIKLVAWTVPVASNLPGYSEIWKEQDQRVDDKEVWGKGCGWSLGMDKEYECIGFPCEYSSKVPPAEETFEKQVCKKTSVDVSQPFPQLPQCLLVQRKWRAFGSRNGYVWLHQRGVLVKVDLAAEHPAFQQQRPTLSSQRKYPVHRRRPACYLVVDGLHGALLSWSGQGFALLGVSIYSRYGIAFSSSSASASTIIVGLSKYLVYHNDICQ